MSVTVSNNSYFYSNYYTPQNSSTHTKQVPTSTSESLKTENTNTAFLGAITELPDENLKKEDRLGQIQFGNDDYAVVFKDENFSEENPVVKVYSKNNSTGEWTKTTVDLNSVNKNNMSVLESFGVGEALEALGKTDTHGSLRLICGFNEMHDFSNNYSYEDLFAKYDVKTMFANEMQTQYKCGNMKGYYYFKQVYDTFFND